MRANHVTTALAIALLALLAAGCGTAESGAEAASSADAQVPPTAPQDPGPAIATPDPGQVPRPPVGQPADEPPSGGACAADSDCVPAAFCHAKACVAAAQKPSCEGVMCTMDCRPGTLDCGGGKCLCQAGVCAAAITKPPFAQDRVPPPLPQ